MFLKEQVDFFVFTRVGSCWYSCIRIDLITNTSEHESTRSNTNLTRVNTGPTRVQHESTRINTSLTQVNTRPTRVRHEPTRINTSLKRVNTSPTQVNTNQHVSKGVLDDSNMSQHESNPC